MCERLDDAMKFVLLLATLTAFWFHSPAVHAQSAQDDVRILDEPISDALADQLLALVTGNLARARGSDGQPLPPLSEAERARPLFERTFVKEIFDVGVASGIAEACGMNWQDNNYLPLMKRERSRHTHSQHQIAAISMLHGLGQEYASKEPCLPDDKKNLPQFYRKKWAL